MRLFVLLPLALLLSACATHPGEQVAVHTANYGWIDEILSGEGGTPQRIWGQLSFPQDLASSETQIEMAEAAPSSPVPAIVPAIVLVHSAQGRDSQMWMYADRFNALGIATLTLDSFTQRGIQKIMRDQTDVTEASMIADAYAALHLLAADPRIDPDRIALFGISKGGAPTIYASMEHLAEALSPDGSRFALHIAYYPWCGVRFLETATTGAPILIQTGARDRITPAAHCTDLLDEWEQENPGLETELVIHENARHAFDHPGLAHFPAIPTNYLAPYRCMFREVSPGHFVEESRNVEVTGDNLSATLEACSRAGFLAGGNPEAAAAAWQNTVQTLRDHLLFISADEMAANESW